MACLLSPAIVQTEVAVLSSTALSGHKVILHEDDHHQISYVVVALRQVVTLGEGEAAVVATTAWTEGTAVVIVCPLEAAEHYQEQLSSYGLKVTVEHGGA